MTTKRAPHKPEQAHYHYEFLGYRQTPGTDPEEAELRLEQVHQRIIERALEKRAGEPAVAATGTPSGRCGRGSCCPMPSHRPTPRRRPRPAGPE